MKTKIQQRFHSERLKRTRRIRENKRTPKSGVVLFIIGVTGLTALLSVATYIMLGLAYAIIISIMTPLLVVYKYYSIKKQLTIKHNLKTKRYGKDKV